MASDANLPSFKRAELVAVEPDLALVDDLLQGTRRMWDQSAAAPYILKWDDEKQATYDKRRKSENCFEGLGRILSASVGMLFAKAPQVEWNESEAQIAPHWDNIDSKGTKGTVFVKRFSERAIRDGLALILVDHPAPPTDTEGNPVTVTSKTESDFNLRPTWAMYTRAQGLSWFDDKVNNQQILTDITLFESASVPDGLFGSKVVQRYRTLKLLRSVFGNIATWTLRELRGEPDNAASYVVIGSGIFTNRNGQPADFLPLSIAYTGRTEATLTSTLPLKGVAWSNLRHWQISTDLAYYLRLCAYPQPVVIGEFAKEPGANGIEVPGRLRLGPGVALHLIGDGASFAFAEISGTSTEPLEKKINEKLTQMAQQGMSFLQSDTRAAETAEAKRLDASSENSTLATAAQGIEDAVNSAWEYHAWYLGIEKKGAPVLTISRDYENTAMDSGLMGAYTALVNAGFPKRPIVEALVIGQRLPSDTNIDDLVLEWEAGQAAEEEAKRAEAAARTKAA